MDWHERLPLIAILRGITPAEITEHTHALLEAGFQAIEVPLNSPEWARSIETALAIGGDRALVGAGTVLSVAHVDALNRLNARLVVTPNTRPTVISHAVACGMQVCAGCATATEAFEALDAGAQALKIFPSTCFGPDYIKALKAVLPAQVPIFAVGGVTPQNLSSYLQAGCLGAGLGSDLYRAGQSAETTFKHAQAFVSAYQETRQ
ncbi:MAG: 2-dehydro-3-deoxy-6-phosphogalactonate aldolase [Rhodocyclaceae bacterium]